MVRWANRNKQSQYKDLPQYIYMADQSGYTYYIVSILIGSIRHKVYKKTLEEAVAVRDELIASERGPILEQLAPRVLTFQ